MFFIILPFVTFAQKNLAVATFDILGNAVTVEEAEAITELYMIELVSTGKVRVVDRKNFDKILDEMNFQNSDWSDSNMTIELGKVINADLLARGQIAKLGSKIYLSASVIDPNTARVLSASNEQFNSVDEIFGLLSKLAGSVVDGLLFKIGDYGPGGGIIYRVDNFVYYEYSECLGETTWDEACELCNNYSGGGYNDWYLPAFNEVNSFSQYRRSLGYEWEALWTSSESEGDEAQAYIRDHSSCDFRVKPKTDKYKVRAIRCFPF